MVFTTTVPFSALTTVVEDCCLVPTSELLAGPNGTVAFQYHGVGVRDLIAGAEGMFTVNKPSAFTVNVFPGTGDYVPYTDNTVGLERNGSVPDHRHQLQVGTDNSHIQLPVEW